MKTSDRKAKRKVMTSLNLNDENREDISSYLIGKMLLESARDGQKAKLASIKTTIEENREYWICEHQHTCSNVMFNTIKRLHNRDGFMYELKFLRDGYEDDLNSIKKEAKGLTLEMIDNMNKITPKAFKENVCEYLLTMLLKKLIHDTTKIYDYEALLNSINLQCVFCSYNNKTSAERRTHICRTIFAKMNSNSATSQTLREVCEEFIA